MLNNINGIKVTSPGFNIAVLLNFLYPRWEYPVLCGYQR